jgi:Zn-dependent protease with chaperone function
VFCADAPARKWEINVLDSPQLIALCMPGGKVVFYTRLIEQPKLSGV